MLWAWVGFCFCDLLLVFKSFCYSVTVRVVTVFIEIIMGLGSSVYDITDDEFWFGDEGVVIQLAEDLNPTEV